MREGSPHEMETCKKPMCEDCAAAYRKWCRSCGRINNLRDTDCRMKYDEARELVEA